MAVPVCKDCLTDHRIPGTPKHPDTEFAGVVAYRAEPSNGITKTDTVILFATDIFGLGLPNSRIMADEMAERCGCPVWVPDMFNGDRLDSDKFTWPDEVYPNEGYLTRFLKTLPGLPVALFNLSPLFLFRHRESVVQKLLKDFLGALKAQNGAKKIALVGYCFGGMHAIKLATQTNLIDVVAVAHPGPVWVGDYAKFRQPASLVVADEDMWTPAPVRAKARAMLESRVDGPPFEWRVYEGTTHGFAARPNLALPTIKQAYLDAMDQVVNWFNEYLK